MFEVGDRVRCIDEAGNVKLGEEYTVTHTYMDYCNVKADDGLVAVGYFQSRFELVSPETHGQSVQTFDTGARRDVTTGKSRPDLVPGCVMLRVGQHFGMGAEKYGERNFEKGIPSSRTLASLCRHVEQYKAGDESEDHLAAIVANAVFLMFNEHKFEGDTEILDLERYTNDH